MRIKLPTTLMPRGVALALACVLPARLTGQSCKPPSETTAAIIGRLTYWIIVTDPARVTLRDTKFKIPVVPRGQLAVATDSRICAKAAQAYAAEFARSPSPSVFTITMGSGSSTWYAVYDPNADYHELSAVLIFDRRWNRYGGYAW